MSLQRINLSTSRAPSIVRNHAANTGAYLMQELTLVRIAGVGLVVYGVALRDIFGLASIALGGVLLFLSFFPTRKESGE